MIDSLEKKMLKDIERIHSNYREFLIDFKKKVEMLDRYKRKNVSITLAEPVLEALERLKQDFKDEEGNAYPLSYFVEDLITFVLSDATIYALFLDWLILDELEEEAEKEEEENEIEEKGED